MGYGSYEIGGSSPLAGEMGGYGHEATCGHAGCETAIDRGMAYMCGDNPHGGDEDSCGLWFCYEHLTYPMFNDETIADQRCFVCAAEAERQAAEEHDALTAGQLRTESVRAD